MIELRESEAALTEEQLNAKRETLAKDGKGFRWRRFKSLKCGTLGLKQQSWVLNQVCPFGDWKSEEEMNEIGQTWKV